MPKEWGKEIALTLLGELYIKNNLNIRAFLLFLGRFGSQLEAW